MSWAISLKSLSSFGLRVSSSVEGIVVRAVSPQRHIDTEKIHFLFSL
jgi:hypothetical protein